MEFSSPGPYSLLTEQMARHGITVSPADAHGLACALIVTATQDGRLVWERELLSDAEGDIAMDPALYDLLQRQYADLEARVESPDFSLSLCLPGADEALAQRVAGLREWCHGFLFGLGVAGRERVTGLRDDAAEALRDLTEITRLDASQVGSDATDEASLVELEEYVRVAVILIKEGMQAPTRSKQGAANDVE